MLVSKPSTTMIKEANTVYEVGSHLSSKECQSFRDSRGLPTRYTLQLYQSGLQTWCRTLHTKERGYFWIWCTRFCDYRVRPYWYLDTRIKPRLHFGLGILFDPCQKIGLISSWACQPLKLIVYTSMCVVQFLPTQGDAMASNTVYCCHTVALW